MRRLVLALLLVAAGGALPLAWAGGRAEPDGATTYREHCGRCHAARAPSDLAPGAWRAAAFHMRTRTYLDRAETDALVAFLAPEAPVAAPGPGGARGVVANPVVAAQCTRCHPADRIDVAVAGGRTEAEWEATIARMRVYGATLAPAETRPLAAWLAGQSSNP